MNAKEPVRLRTRLLTSGRRTIYLDTYYKGTRKVEALQLYLEPETSRELKERNAQTWALANAIKDKRLAAFQAHRFGLAEPGNPRLNFLDYMAKKRDEARADKTRNMWDCTFKRLVDYSGSIIPFETVTARWFEGFRHFLETKTYNRNMTRSKQPLSPNAVRQYMAFTYTAYRSAYKEGIITENLLQAVKLPAIQESGREWLTTEELRRLAETPCKYELMKREFLFACLTGLRKSDLFQMRWDMIDEAEGGCRIYRFHHQKTHRLQYLQISAQAARLMGERGKGSAHVWPQIGGELCYTKNLQDWCHAAGIAKHITFHCARHTFACLMLETGADIYTVQQLLNHANIKTTQVYAKIVDKRKMEAVNRLPDIL